ncbi:hypothetical protein Hanom_Chr01g00080511 [Helianthus anomalus]
MKVEVKWRMKMMIRNKGLWRVLDIVIDCGEWCEVSGVYMEDNNMIGYGQRHGLKIVGAGGRPTLELFAQ